MYRENQKEFSEEIFADPPVEYRDFPFWAWNTEMTKEDIDFGLSIFKEMGMGGAFLHSRTGLNIPYLGEKFMDLIDYACSRAEETGLIPWLYDEDRWPSGFAGGLVTKEKANRSRFLVWSPEPLREGQIVENRGFTSSAAPVRSGERKFYGIYEVTGKNGYLKSYRRLKDWKLHNAQTEDGEQDFLWWAYLEISGDNPWFNGQSYVDTLNTEAIKQFIDITYEGYRLKLGDKFGCRIPGIFTDEPQFTPKQRAEGIESRETVILPFTDVLPELFLEKYHFDLMNALPELFYDWEDRVSLARYCYHDLTSQMFAESYAGQIGKWCKNHRLALTGHLMKEPLLSSQTQYVGEAMRAYPAFEIPGIDILCDRHEYTTAKQAQSIVHQYGKSDMISELFGVTNWDYDFRGHKLQGDWQAALGVTMRAPHLSWTSMEGEAKRDYPASIFYQSPWYQEYRLMEDYFARITSVMSRGNAVVRIGVIHPIETCWLHWGTLEKTGERVRELDEQFLQLTDWLIGGSFDFDFISEALLPELYREGAGADFLVGEMSYRVVIVSNMETIRWSTMEALRDFHSRGGAVVFCGRIPACVNGKLSNEGMKLAEQCKTIPFIRSSLLGELQEFSEVELFEQGCGRIDDVICQLREEGTERFLFMAHKKNPKGKDMARARIITVRMRGSWLCRRLDAVSGCGEDMEARPGLDGWTETKVRIYEHDSVLIHLTPFFREGQETQTKGEKASQEGYAVREKAGEEGQRAGGRGGSRGQEVQYCKRTRVSLSEPNVLVLDMPEYSLDGEEWKEEEEILRIDNEIRKRLGYPLRMEAWPQPWVMQKEDEEIHKVELRYFIYSECEVREVWLALERPEEAEVYWQGNHITGEPVGWYVDKRIRKVALGGLKKGWNELRMVRSFGSRTNLEAVFLVGGFGVQVTGRRAVVTTFSGFLDFGDWTVQGLPFYGGNVTYHISVIGEERPLKIKVGKFRSPVLRVDYREKKQGNIVFSPYELVTEKIEKGEQRIDITAFGNRLNTFGALHNCDDSDHKAAPGYWRSEGDAWSYEYCIQSAGILKAPEITRC